MVDRAGFSATDAALTGFEIARREPLTVLVWSLAQAVVVAPLSWVFASAMAPYRAQLRADSITHDPAAMLAVLGRLAPLQLLSALVFTALFAVLYCGVYRAVLRPAEGGPGRLRVGADELRVAGVLVALFLLTFLIGVAAVLVGGVVGALLALALPAMRAFWVVAAFVAALAGLAVVAVRLSLSPPMTFATGRMTVVGSWRVTRGRFWALFGTYLVAGLLAAIIQLAAAAVFALVVLLAGGGLPALQAMFHTDAGDAAGLTWQDAGFRLLFALVSGFVVALLAGAPASAYAQLTGGGRPSTAVPPPGSDLPRFGR